MYIPADISATDKVYGSWLLICSAIPHFVAEHATTVVSEIGDD